MVQIAPAALLLFASTVHYDIEYADAARRTAVTKGQIVSIDTTVTKDSNVRDDHGHALSPLPHVPTVLEIVLAVSLLYLVGSLTLAAVIPAMLLNISRTAY
jgi:hypothetical protein